MATMSSPPGARFKGASKGFQIDTFPPYIASPFWPTAPYVPAPKFVRMPENVRFVPEHNWGCSNTPDGDCTCCQGGADGQFGALGAPSAKKKQAKKRAAKLRQRAAKVEKKAGIVRKPTKAKFPTKGAGAKKKAPPRKKAKEAAPEEPAEESAEESAEKELPAPEGVPQDAAEGSANMKYIIGGTLALMAAIGVGFAMQQSKKKKAAAAASPAGAPSTTAAVALPELPFTRTERVAEPAAVPAEEPAMPLSANPRGSLLMLSVRPFRR